MLAATVIAGLCFRKMMHNALAICFISFFIDPRPVTLHTVMEYLPVDGKLASQWKTYRLMENLPVDPKCRLRIFIFCNIV